MIDIIPFKALRPRREAVQSIASRPYDVISLAEARKIAAENPLTFLLVEKTGVNLPHSMNIDDPEAYELTRMNLDRYIQEGLLFQEGRDCFYIYRQAMGSHEQYGLVACVSVRQYEEGKVKRHELTRADKELDRIRHVLAANAQTGPVFLTYPAMRHIDDAIASLSQNPTEYDFLAPDGVRHTVWVVSDEEEIERLKAGFARVEVCYIADGHHRAAAAAEVARRKREESTDAAHKNHYDYMLAVLFPQDQLRILPYNRAVRDLNGLTHKQFLEKIKDKFYLTPDFTQKMPCAYDEFGMILTDGWYGLKAKEGFVHKDDPVLSLSASILQDKMLGPILGIYDPRKDERIEFIGGVNALEEMEELVISGEYAVAFSLYPTTLAQLMQVADAERLLPPKSTWFEPKLLSGIFVHLL